ncbi:MAG: CBS domain-containing protein [Elusimicrobia bacterium]|nr:CBS domain-containing protein [Elusimicrobiota bacterium]
MPQTAKVLMREVEAVPPDTTAAEAARRMKKSNIGSLFVGDPGKPAGIFTERDLARRVVAEGLDPEKTKVSAVMTRKLVTVESSEPLNKVFLCLARGNFRHLPISEKGRVVGIVSLSDLAKVLGEMAADEKYLSTFSDEVA